MTLVKTKLQEDIRSKLVDIFKAQSEKATNGDESEDPIQVINDISDKMASAIADAVDSYVKDGVIVIGPDNISVTTSSGPGTVAPLNPAKLI